MMPSFVWDRTPSDAFQEPYEYGGQEQFSREAVKVVMSLKDHYKNSDVTFDRNERTLKKAVWMLQLDSLEAIIDSLDLIEEKRHRLASRLFRDAIETMDISVYFYLGGDEANKDLEKWYDNKVIPHRKYREFVEKNVSAQKAERSKNLYGDLSRYTHRTYSAMGDSYILARENKIAYDGFAEGTHRVLPHTISVFYAVIAAVIKRFFEAALETHSISSDTASLIWKNALEEVDVPRRFGNGPGQLLRTSPIPFELVIEEDDSHTP